MKEESMITSVGDARACKGQRVYWDDVGTRYIFLRDGILEDAEGANVLIDGDWKHRSSLKNLRNFEMGGAWKRNKEAK